jgi:hypothetical protein
MMTLRLAAIFLLAAACTLNRPSTGPGRTNPMTTAVTATSRDTLFARAFAAMRERGYTEITPDTAAHQVRGKSPHGTSVTVSLDAVAGDSTRVTISAAGDRRSIGMDTEAMSTAQTLMADVTRPVGVMVDSPVRPIRPPTPDSTTRKP